MGKKNILIGLLLFSLILFAAFFLFRNSLLKHYFSPTTSEITLGVTQEKMLSSNSDSDQESVQVVAENLEIPWEIVFLPDSSLLVTERPGILLRINSQERQKILIAGVEHTGEGGLLGLELHPDFEKNNWIYLYLTTKTSTGLINRVERYNFDLARNRLSNKKTIIDNIPGATFHDGGRIAFGPDGMLYITTGDAGKEDSAQDRGSLAGKILRVTDLGAVPSDNPFNNPVYSYGHRNPQGLAWDQAGKLWISEHGPSGLESGLDEINLVKKGQNYGWPLVKGDEAGEGLVGPVIHSGTKDTWAPAGLEIFGEKLFFVGLRGEALYSAKMAQDKLKDLKANFKGEFGRLRIVKLSPDKKWLYVATSNTDGRGTVQEGDDKIIRLRVDQLE